MTLASSSGTTLHRVEDTQSGNCSDIDGYSSALLSSSPPRRESAGLPSGGGGGGRHTRARVSRRSSLDGSLARVEPLAGSLIRVEPQEGGVSGARRASLHSSLGGTPGTRRRPSPVPAPTAGRRRSPSTPLPDPAPAHNNSRMGEELTRLPGALVEPSEGRAPRRLPRRHSTLDSLVVEGGGSERVRAAAGTPSPVLNSSPTPWSADSSNEFHMQAAPRRVPSRQQSDILRSRSSGGGLDMVARARPSRSPSPFSQEHRQGGGSGKSGEVSARRRRASFHVTAPKRVGGDGLGLVEGSTPLMGGRSGTGSGSGCGSGSGVGAGGSTGGGDSGGSDSGGVVRPASLATEKLATQTQQPSTAREGTAVHRRLPRQRVPPRRTASFHVGRVEASGGSRAQFSSGRRVVGRGAAVRRGGSGIELSSPSVPANYGGDRVNDGGGVRRSSVAIRDVSDEASSSSLSGSLDGSVGAWGAGGAARGAPGPADLGSVMRLQM